MASALTKLLKLMRSSPSLSNSDCKREESGFMAISGIICRSSLHRVPRPLRSSRLKRLYSALISLGSSGCGGGGARRVGRGVGARILVRGKLQSEGSCSGGAVRLLERQVASCEQHIQQQPSTGAVMSAMGGHAGARIGIVASTTVWQQVTLLPPTMLAVSAALTHKQSYPAALRPPPGGGRRCSKLPCRARGHVRSDGLLQGGRG